MTGHKSIHVNQHGFTLVQAIFVLVVLGMLGTYMVTLLGVQQSTSTLAVQQARAYQAARAGVEWAAARIADGKALNNASFVVAGTGCTVTVVVDKVDYSEVGSPGTIYHIASVAVSTGLGKSSPDYVSRTLEVTLQ